MLSINAGSFAHTLIPGVRFGSVFCSLGNTQQRRQTNKRVRCPRCRGALCRVVFSPRLRPRGEERAWPLARLGAFLCAPTCAATEHLGAPTPTGPHPGAALPPLAAPRTNAPGARPFACPARPLRSSPGELASLAEGSGGLGSLSRRSCFFGCRNVGLKAVS